MNIPMRPAVVPDDRFSQPMPHSPYDHLPPPSHSDIDSAFSHMHRTLPRGYFDIPMPSASGQFPASMRPGSPLPRSPYPAGYSSSYGPEMYPGSDMPYNTQQSTEELVRKTNLAVQLVNGQISHSARYAQLQPKMDRNGKFPIEFRSPRTVEEVRAMDSSTVERILTTYQLPIDLRSFKINSVDSVPSKVSKQAKLCTLFDFLGATRLADHERLSAERWKRTMVLAY